ncbi:MAG TPA: histidinol-phosphatase [Microscillaceae bacterium]|nr:histidinol-phosphatase [Microscillaceae bacterium]
MYWTNYHGHSNYCDGTHLLEEYITAAIDQNVKAYGFSGHAPLPFLTNWAMPYEHLVLYFKEIDDIKQKYAEKIQVYTGLEQDYVADFSLIHKHWKALPQLDYVIGSVHFVDRFSDGRYWEIDNTTKIFKEGLQAIFQGDVPRAIQRYYALIREMIEVQQPTIVGHLDKIKMHNRHELFFDESDSWYQEAVEQTLQTIAQTNTIVEINTRGVYKKKAKETYPSHWIIKRMQELNIPVTINSDAHHPEEVTKEFATTTQVLQDLGYKTLRVLWNGQWQDVGFCEQGLDLK